MIDSSGSTFTKATVLRKLTDTLTQHAQDGDTFCPLHRLELKHFFWKASFWKPKLTAVHRGARDNCN
jgi:hypothetical protein